jgi:transcriptional regulator with XRE-family HTH domain
MTRRRWPRELGEFLRARRDALAPDRVRPHPGRGRHVPGLRRDEVAALASISTDYYKRIEQGRIAVTEPVLDSLSQALHLSGAERDYAAALAGHAELRAPGAVPREASGPLLRLLDELVLTPAMILGPGTEVIAWNAQASALFTDFGALGPFRRIMIGLVFLDPEVRSRHLDWHRTAREYVARLRYDSACRPDDPALLALVEELSARDVDFRTWWNDHRAEDHRPGSTGYVHPLAGELWLERATLLAPGDPAQRLVTLTAEPGSPSDDGLRRLRQASDGGARRS